MSTELARYLKALDKRQFEVGDGVVTCWFGTKGQSRRHSVRLQDTADAIRFQATIATARTLELMEDDPQRWAWRRNRSSALIGFRVDSQRRLIAEAIAPKYGLTNDEFLIYLRVVATEADRMELVLTGRD